jgi:phthiocerol/phenolphthiocerol synthesis type-I polyketide synthase E
MESQNPETTLDGIAIIAMAGRFPQSQTLGEFWQNLCNGVESVTFLSPDEDHALVSDPTMRNNPHYVPAGAFLENIDLFDASFFGYTAREAQIIDPQHRLLLECAWELLEQAGYDTHQYPGRIGVYAGAGSSTYYLNHIHPNRELEESMGGFQKMIGNEKDFLATRLAYKLGLKGPAITVQTGCSTSLTAVALATQSLLGYQCDLALAGGVSVTALEAQGYIYEAGGVSSPDGHCRAFDANAQGTFFGNGLGLVLLKRLEDALADNDQIYAVIKGIAINNDGDLKAGYTAPGIEGQAEVIAEALALADVHPETIGYVETHGTGTHLGDPIEIAALTRAFREKTQKRTFCAIGSVKTNIGHLDAAAGVVGLIKASLALKYKVIPPSLNFTRPNPEIDFANSPFYVNTQLTPWIEEKTPRRAGVSSFGIGGTNVHAILEEAPLTRPGQEESAPVLLVLSARTASALEASTDNLVAYLQEHPELIGADVAWTLQLGRRAFAYRRIVVGETLQEALHYLQTRDPQRVFSNVQKAGDTSLAFLFPGQGVEHLHMGQQFYTEIPLYREWIDRCAELLFPLLNLDIRHVLFASEENAAGAEQQLAQPQMVQVTLFVTEYALARLLQDLGLQPAAMLGHSLGEYVAACLAGVISLEDALFLVVERGRLVQDVMLPGAMLSVSLSADEASKHLNTDLSLAAMNGPELCTIAGPEAAIIELAQQLTEKGIENRRLHVMRAFHSTMIEPIQDHFRQALLKIRLHSPQLPYISCATGTWISADEATDPEYWVRHLRQPVRFSQALQTLLQQPGCTPIEVGPRQTLLTLFKLHIQRGQRQSLLSVPTMGHQSDQQSSDQVTLRQLLGKLWLAGVNIHFARLYTGARQRTLLPTYPFERQRFWIPEYLFHAPDMNPKLVSTITEDHALNENEDAISMRAYLSNDYTAPGTTTEQKVAEIWQEYLGSGDIGIHDNFFELGGHSLLATRLIARLRNVFQTELTERSLYQHQTIAALSETIDQNQQKLQPLVPVSRDQLVTRNWEQLFPVSWNQQWRWVCDQQHPEQASISTIAFAWELIGPLDRALFEKSVQELAKRHETLRTTFVLVEGTLYQKIVPELNVSLPMTDLTCLPEDMRDEEMLRLAHEQSRIAFDMLSSFPLWKMMVYKLAEDKYSWTTLAHQSIWDGPSLFSVDADIKLFMDTQNQGLSWKPSPLPIQFIDWVQWEQRHFQGEVLEASVQYWREKLAGDLTPLLLPTDRPRTQEFAFSKIQEFNFSDPLNSQLKTLAKEQSTTLYTVLLALYKTLCNVYTNTEDILVCTTVANRLQSELELMVAPLANTVALRTNLCGNPTFLEIVARVKETVLGASIHKDLPFAKVLEEIRPDLYATHDPLSWSLMVQYEGIPYPELGNLAYGRRFWTRRALAETYIAIVDCEEHIAITWEYDIHLFNDETVEKMILAYRTLAEQVIADPEQTLADLSASLHPIAIPW